MNHRIFDDEQIRKLNEQLIPIAEKITKETLRKYRSTPNAKASVKKGNLRYHQTEKYKLSRRRKRQERTRVLDQAILDNHELSLLQQFYGEMPKGYDMDHIIPISKGGKHCLANLQWLTKKDNLRKSDRLVLEENDFPQCFVDVNKWFLPN